MPGGLAPRAASGMGSDLDATPSDRTRLVTSLASELDGLGALRRTHACGAVTSELIGQELVLAGWVHRRRDHGGVIFVDLRDREGLVQVVFRPDFAEAAHQHAAVLRSEFVILVRGTVEPRSADTVNPKLISALSMLPKLERN